MPARAGHEFDQRQWRHQARTARARIAAPGAVPLTGRGGDIVAGAVIRTVQHPVRSAARIPYPRLRSHQVVIGTTGTGKTTLVVQLVPANRLGEHEGPVALSDHVIIRQEDFSCAYAPRVPGRRPGRLRSRATAVE